MNITFLVGNGFDLNLGLKTSYTNFLKWCEENGKCEINSILEIYKEDKEKKESVVYWADMERKLGQITSSYQPENKLAYLDFIEDKAELESLLMEYLSKEQNKAIGIESSNYKLIDEFQHTIEKMFDRTNEVEKKKIRRVFLNSSDKAIHIDFITFNYTNILKRIVDAVKWSGRELTIKNFLSESPIKLRIGKVFHVHGTVNYKPVLGANSEHQIKREDFSRNIELCNYMIKERINEICGDERYQNAEKIINNSDIVILFGLSYGSTDGRWRDFLKTWAMNNDNRLLVLMNYVESMNKDTITVFDDVKGKEIAAKVFAGIIDTSKKEEYLKKAIVVFNNNVFNFRVLKKPVTTNVD